MAANVTIGDSRWVCVGAESIKDGCVKTRASCGPCGRCDAHSQVPDLKHHDYVGKALPEDGGLASLARRSTGDLVRSMLETLKDAGAGGLGVRMTRHFLQGSQVALFHTFGSTLSDQARSTRSYKSGRAEILRELRKKLRPQFRAGRATYDFELPGVPWIEFNAFWHCFLPFSSTRPLGAVIGGTKGTKVFVRRLSVVPRNTLRFMLRVELCDHFGVDESDCYCDGLRAFWLLQHARPGPQKPFVNIVIVEEPVTIDCSPPMTRAERLRLLWHPSLRR